MLTLEMFKQIVWNSPSSYQNITSAKHISNVDTQSIFSSSFVRVSREFVFGKTRPLCPQLWVQVQARWLCYLMLIWESQKTAQNFSVSQLKTSLVIDWLIETRQTFLMRLIYTGSGRWWRRCWTTSTQQRVWWRSRSHRWSECLP